MKLLLTKQERELFKEAADKGTLDVARFVQCITPLAESTPPATFNSWNETLSASAWQTATGATLLMYINAEDSSTATIDIDNGGITALADKSASNNPLTIESQSFLNKEGSTNAIAWGTGFGYNNAVGAALSGNPFSKPHFVPIQFKIPSFPSSKETLWSQGGNTTDTGRSLSITTSGQLEINWKDNSGNTATLTSSLTLPLNKKISVLTFWERSRVRVFVHDGDTNLFTKFISGSGGVNVSTTIDRFILGSLYRNGSFGQSFTGHFYSILVAQGIFTNSYTLMEKTLEMTAIPYSTVNASTINSGLVGHFVFPGPGGASPASDAVDLVSGLTLPSNNSPTTGTGLFHNSTVLNGTSQYYYLANGVNATWNIGNQAAFSLFARFKVSENSSNRCLFGMMNGASSGVRLIQFGGFVRLYRDAVNVLTSAVSLANGQWYTCHLWLSGGTINLQVDTETPVSAAWTARDTLNYGLMIGAGAAALPTVQHYWQGDIDCISLWSRATTTTERTELRNNGSFREGFYEYLIGAEPPVVAPAIPPYWGPQIAGTTLNSPQLHIESHYSQSNKKIWITCKMPVTGYLKSIKSWLKTGPSSGYSSGNPKFKIQIQSDSGGVPSGSLIAAGAETAEFTVTNPNSSITQDSSNYRNENFTTPPLISKDTKFHVVFNNTSLTDIWCSLNCIMNADGGKSQNAPTWDNNTFQFRHPRDGYAAYIPCTVLGIDLTNDGTIDHWFGNPYIETHNYNNDNTSNQPNYIGAVQVGRVILPVHAGYSPTLNAINIAAYRTQGNGNLTCTIKNAGGSTVATTNIPASQFSTYTYGSRLTNPVTWGRSTFSSPPTLSASTTYYLELSSDTSTRYWPSILREGDVDRNGITVYNWGGVNPTGLYGGWYAGSGKYQQSVNSGSSWSEFPGGGTKDLAFYFEVS